MILGFGWPQGPKNSSVWLDLSQNLFAQMKGGKSSLLKELEPNSMDVLGGASQEDDGFPHCGEAPDENMEEQDAMEPVPEPASSQPRTAAKSKPRAPSPQSWRQWPVRSTQRNSSKPRKNQE